MRRGDALNRGCLLVMNVLSFIAMYVLMYAMVNRLANVYPSFNQLHMAGVMTAAIVIIELVATGGMYPNRKLKLREVEK
jgi:hypothetical protein